MSWWLRAPFLSHVWRSPLPLQSSALCLCSSARAVKVSTCSKITTSYSPVNIGLWIVCQILPAQFCFFYFNVNKWLIPCCVPDEGLLGTDLSLSSCVVDLSRGPCRDGVCSRAVIHFSPVTDFVKDGNRTTHISVKSIVTPNFLWNGYSPEPVEVNI